MKNQYTDSIVNFLEKETLKEPLHDALRLITTKLDANYPLSLEAENTISLLRNEIVLFNIKNQKNKKKGIGK